MSDRQVPAFDASTAYESPCHACGETVSVSAACLEMAKSANHILSRMGEACLTKAEIAICRPCYDLRYSRIWAEAEVHSEAYARIWARFKIEYRQASEARRPEIEIRLKNDMGDWWGSYSGLFTAWKGELATRKGYAGASRDKGAGFNG